ncbi:WAP four-disulfide core domain protein 1-like [Mytilus edulis]|uniref:WAP four-disulfide core domain protein 1-like n=1 Tax=Mytilus edulis TaxID=6550 RepID=UPI0039EE3CF7
MASIFIKMLTFNVVTGVLFGVSLGKVVYDVDFDDDDGKWLSDDENYETSKDYLGDSVAGLVLQDNEKCPALPEVISSSACMATPCFHDKDCGTSEGRCCDNGCVFTCFSYPIGPTYIDWVREPRRQQVNGISWLMKGPNLAEELEPCSTTYHEDEDPLLCPTGYICHVERLGNSKKDVPNLGHCIPEKDVFPTVDPNPSRHLETDCYLEKYLMADGAKIKVRNRTCYCKQGFLSCLID